MNGPDFIPTTEKPAGEERHESLQLQLTLQLLALVIMAATLAFFFYVHARRAKFDLNLIRQPAAALIQTYEQEKPNVEAFLAKLVEYSRTHPEFVPLLQKYPLLFTPAPAPAAAPQTSAPAATAAPKSAAPAPAPKPTAPKSSAPAPAPKK